MLKQILSTSFVFVIGMSNAFAITDTWDFSDLSKDRHNLVGHDFDMSSGSVNLNGSGFAYSRTQINQSDIYLWNNGGLGIVNQYEDRDDYPGHAFDNNGSTDMILLSFDSEVSLTGLDLAWAKDDGQNGRQTGEADLSILAFTGPSFSGIEGLGWGAITTDWSVENNMKATTSGGYQSVATGTFSKYWLVSAYNTVFGDSGLFDSAKDSFKLAGIQTERNSVVPASSVPEPTGILLMALAIFGVVQTKSRKRS